MGEVLADRLVSLAFIADEGKVSDHGSGSEDLDPTPADAIEARLTRAGFEHALLNLHATAPGAAWMHAPFLAGPLGYTSMRSRWDSSFDAFVFSPTHGTQRHRADAPADAGAPDSGAGHHVP